MSDDNHNKKAIEQAFIIRKQINEVARLQRYNDELVTMNENQTDRIDNLLAQNKSLEGSYALLAQECQSLSDENKARWKTEKSLIALLHHVASVLAVDTIIDRTHRERNIVMRSLIKRILQSFNDDGIDDIPF